MVGAAAAAGAPTATAQSDGPDYGGWFDNVDNFDGTVDYTGQSEVIVTVGASGNGGYYAFAPPAIRVDPGTTVTWEWTGEGGSHNVVDNDGAYESELVGDSGHTFSHTFEEGDSSPRISKYYCGPHQALGMKGAVVVGGSGGIPPSEYGGQQTETPSGTTGAPSDGGSEGGNTGGESGSGSQSGTGGLSVGAAAILMGMLVALLSPLFFGMFQVLFDSSGPGDRST